MPINLKITQILVIRVIYGSTQHFNYHISGGGGGGAGGGQNDSTKQVENSDGGGGGSKSPSTQGSGGSGNTAKVWNSGEIQQQVQVMQRRWRRAVVQVVTVQIRRTGGNAGADARLIYNRPVTREGGERWRRRRAG